MVEGLHHFGDVGVHVPIVDVELDEDEEGQQCSLERLSDKIDEAREGTKSM